MDSLKSIKELLNNKVITKEEYDRLANRLAPAKEVNDYTWGDILDNYIDWCNGKYTISTIKGYKICIQKFIKYTTKSDDYDKAANQKFKTYTFQGVTNFVEWMHDDNLCSQAISKVKYALVSLGLYLNDIGVEVPDINAIKTPIKVNKEENLTALREEEVYEVVESSDLRSKVAILLSYEAGLKRIELAKVKTTNFNFSKNQLFVYQDDGTIDRVCILSDYAIKTVRRYINSLYEDIDRWNESRIEKGIEPREDFGYIFQSVKTTIPSYPMLQSMIKKSAKKYYEKKFKGDELKQKVGNFTFETLRNSRRVYLLAHGKTVAQTMLVVGDRNYMSTYKLNKLVPMLYPELM